MKAKTGRAGKRKAIDRDTQPNNNTTTARKILMLLLLAFVFLSITAEVTEAAAMDSVKNLWSKMKNYVLRGAFWINAIIIFGVGFLLYTLLLSNKVGSDTSTKVIMILILILVSTIIATKIVDNNGVPQYLWHNDQFRKFTQFLIGPSAADAKNACATPVTHSLGKSILGITPNPPCCGTGAYENRGGICKQAILRTNENGSGIPALLIGFLAFYLLFSAYGSSLGTSGSKWFPITMSIVLAAIVANSRITKNNLIMVAGWVAVLLLSNKLSKSFGGGDEKSKSKAGLGIGLAIAFVELAANLLGGSLFGGSFAAGDIHAGRIIKIILIGFIAGYIFSNFSSIFSRITGKLSKEQKEDVQKHIDDGKYVDPFARDLPGAGRWWFRPEKEAEEVARRDETIMNELNRIRELRNQLQQQPHPDWRQITQLDAYIAKLQDTLLKELERKDIEMDDATRMVSKAEQETERPPTKPPPESPNIG
jgi:hypothetical protein